MHQNKKENFKSTVNFIISEARKNYNATYDFEEEGFKEAAKKAMEKRLNEMVCRTAFSDLKKPMLMNFQ